MREEDREEGDIGVRVVVGLRVVECGVVIVVGEEGGEDWRKDHGFGGRESRVEEGVCLCGEGGFEWLEESFVLCRRTGPMAFC